MLYTKTSKLEKIQKDNHRDLDKLLANIEVLVIKL